MHAASKKALEIFILNFLCLKMLWLDTKAHTCNPSTQEAKVRRAELCYHSGHLYQHLIFKPKSDQRNIFPIKHSGLAKYPLELLLILQELLSILQELFSIKYRGRTDGSEDKDACLL